MAIILTARAPAEYTQDLKESPLTQPPQSVLTYAIDVSAIGTPTGSPGITVYNRLNGNDATSIVCSGGASINASNQIEFDLEGLLSSNNYLCVITFTVTGTGAPYTVRMIVRCDNDGI